MVSGSERKRLLLSPAFWRMALNVACVIALAWFALFLGNFGRGLDAVVYYEVDPANPYVNTNLSERGAFLYAPVFAQIVTPLQSLPWPLFYSLFVAGQLAALAYLVGLPLAVILAFIQAPMIWTELEYGNVNLILAALLVFAMRRPQLWSIPILLKATPVVGLTWYVVRREWRSLAIAVGATVAIVAISFVFSPQAWIDWVRLALLGNIGSADNHDAFPMWIRLPVGAAVVAYGARTSRIWALPLGVAIAFAAYQSRWVVLLAIAVWYRPALMAAVGDFVAARRSGKDGIGQVS